MHEIFIASICLASTTSFSPVDSFEFIFWGFNVHDSHFFGFLKIESYQEKGVIFFGDSLQF